MPKVREGKEGIDLLEKARGTRISTYAQTNEEGHGDPHFIVSHGENIHTFESDCKDQIQIQP